MTRMRGLRPEPRQTDERRPHLKVELGPYEIRFWSFE